VTALRSPFAWPDRPFTAADAQALADALKVLADPVRLLILHHLTWHGPLSSGALSKAIDTRRQNVAHHLRSLRQAGLITSTSVDGSGDVVIDAVRALSTAIDVDREDR
jgi:DNA-binding transcriptional ArsR family regulator